VTGFGDDLPDIPRYLAVSIVGSGLLAAVSAAIAAWTPRRAYATAAIIAVFIIPPIIVALIANLAVGDLAQALVLLSPGDVVEGLNAAVFGTIAEGSPAVVAANLPGWTYVASSLIGIGACLAIIVRRYLRVTG
jgi:hypothetical protein